MKKYFKESIRTYGRDYYICFDTDSYQEILKKNKLEDNEDLSNYHGFVVRFGLVLIMFIRDTKDFNTIAHESYHMADRIGEIAGLEYNKGSGNEHYAYMIGEIVENVVKNSIKYNKTLEKENQEKK